MNRTLFSGFLVLFSLSADRIYSAGDKARESCVSDEFLYCRRGLWYVPAKAGNKSVIAIFSTATDGVAVNAPNLDRDFPDLILERGSDPARGNVIFADLPFSCLGLPERKMSAPAMDMTDFSKAMRVPLGAAAGIAYLRHYAFELDPEASKITAMQSPVTLTRGLKVGISWQKERPCAEATLPGLGSRTFVLHTSHGGALQLTSERTGILERMGHLMLLKPNGISIKVIDGKRIDQPAPSSYVLRWLDFGGTRFHNVPVTVGDKDAVGLMILHSFKTTIDFPENTMWLERTTKDNEIRMPSHCQAPELVFDQTGRLVIIGASDGFRLTDHGLAVGDEVMAVNGISSEDLSIWKVRELLSVPGSTLSLELLRGKERFAAKMSLMHSYQWPPSWQEGRIESDSEFEATLK